MCNSFKKIVKSISHFLSILIEFCFVMGLECRKHKIGFDMKTIAEEKFTLKKEIKILPPIESTRDSNKIEKYEICYIMKKEIDYGS